MFSKKKNKDKPTGNTNGTSTANSGTISTSTISNSFQTRSTLYTTTTTRVQRSQSVLIRGSFGDTITTPPNSFDSNFGSNRVSYLRSQFETPRLNHVELDARPFASTAANVPAVINLNYQSPYRNTPQYSSLRANNNTTSIIVPYNAGTQRNTPGFSSFRTPTTAPPTNRQSISSISSLTLPSSSSNSSQSKRKVTLNTEWLDDKNAHIPTYRTRRKKRGEVLIINNIMFGNKQDRRGAKKDDEDLMDLFKQMGFGVTGHRNLKRNSMQSEIRSFSKKSSLKDVDMSIVVVMSHGTNQKRLGGYTEIFGVDDQPCVVDELLNYFTAENCKHMRDKPKIFIFQCCRGDNEKFLESDAVPIRKPNAAGFADMLITFSTVPGFVSHRNVTDGTWYIQTICKIFSEHAHKEHIEDLLKMVDAEMGSLDTSIRQISTYESRGFKRCYLHPRK